MKFALLFTALSVATMLSAVEVTSPYGDRILNPKETLANSIDGKTNTKWFTYLNGKLVWQIKTDAPVAYNSYTLTSANDSPERDPKDWTVEASKDGKTWVKLADVKNNPKFSKRFEAKQFKFDNKTAYSFYRINFTGIHGKAEFQIAEIKFETVK